MKTTCLIFLILLVAFSQAKLQSYNADIKQTSTSGISAGGFMAVQFQVAYSDNVVGSGIVAGGPYFCAQGQLMNAINACMSNPNNIHLDTLKSKIQQFQTKKYIDSIENLKKQNVYLYSGTKDTVVKPGVMSHLKEQLESLGVENIESNFDTPSQHAWITNDFGNKCGFKGEPYINNCDLDVAQKVLEHIYGEDLNVDENVKAKSENLIEFDQTPYKQKGDSLNTKGYVYVPDSCQNGENRCRVHIAFHGCEQTLADIGTKFVEHSGLNRLAEQNNIIVLYPQAKKSSYAPMNPKGCFDWWGYTQSSLPGLNNYKYATKQGSQMISFWNMLNDLTGEGKGYDFFYNISQESEQQI